MKKFYVLAVAFHVTGLLCGYGQCATPGKDGNNYSLNAFPNTYYAPALASYSLETDSVHDITLLPAGIISSVAVPDITPGDLVLIIQMQGASVTTSNNAAYGGNNGTGQGYINDANLLAGDYEYALAATGTTVTATGGGILKLVKPVQKKYRFAAANATAGQYRYQVIKVPQFQNITLSASVTGPAWNGVLGGVLVIEVSQVLDVNGFTIDMAGHGFRGGGGVNYLGTPDFGAYDIYRYPSAVTAHASKGEGIAGTPRFVMSMGTVTDNIEEGYPNGSFGKGAPGNAGGGATDNKPAPTSFDNQFNTGGGGGGNAGSGGKGGWPWNNQPGVIDSTENGGRPGSAFIEGTINRLIMGGGGGAGSANNSISTKGVGSSGTPGGGIILITARKISGTGLLNVSGSDAPDLPGPQPGGDSFSDASGGGGAGGTVKLLVYETPGLSGITVLANGGKGGSNRYGHHGPGAGGGGGHVYTNGPIYQVNASGGMNGRTGPGAGNLNRADTLSLNYGATPGQPGKYSIEPDSVAALNCLPLANDNIILLARQTGNKIELSWTDQFYQLTKKTTIEHSLDSRIWNTVAELIILSETGNFTHTNTGNGKNFYRLKRETAGGAVLYSKIVKCEFHNTGSGIAVSLAANEISITNRQLQQDNYSIQLVDFFGSVVFRKNIRIGDPGSVINIPLQHPVKPGYYIIQLTGANNLSHTEKVFLGK